MSKQKQSKSLPQRIISFAWIAVGAFLAALSLRVFLIPNEIIDGGIVGISMILSKLTQLDGILEVSLILLNLPFIYLAFRFIRKNFVLYMLASVIFFVIFLVVLQAMPEFKGGTFEYVVIGGGLLGIGAGLIIRNGGCLDGTEIMAIIVNRKRGYTVGQVVLAFNLVIFCVYGLIFDLWEKAIDSVLMYVVAFKMMDLVIVGLDELKSVTIITKMPKELSKIITEEMGLGLTVLHGRGGYSGEDRELLMVVVERLDLAELKEIVLRTDESAFMAIENLHEVVHSRTAKPSSKKRRKNRRKLLRK